MPQDYEMTEDDTDQLLIEKVIPNRKNGFYSRFLLKANYLTVFSNTKLSALYTISKTITSIFHLQQDMPNINKWAMVGSLLPAALFGIFEANSHQAESETINSDVKMNMDMPLTSLQKMQLGIHFCSDVFKDSSTYLMWLDIIKAGLKDGAYDYIATTLSDYEIYINIGILAVVTLGDLQLAKNTITSFKEQNAVEYSARQQFQA